MKHEEFLEQFRVLENYFKMDPKHKPDAVREYWIEFKSYDFANFKEICKKMIKEFRQKYSRHFPLIGDFHDFNREIVASRPFKRVETPQPGQGEPATPGENAAFFAVLMEIYTWLEEKALDKDGNLLKYKTMYSHFKKGLPPQSENWELYCKEYLKKLKDKRLQKTMSKRFNERRV